MTEKGVAEPDTCHVLGFNGSWLCNSDFEENGSLKLNNGVYNFVCNRFLPNEVEWTNLSQSVTDYRFAPPSYKNKGYSPIWLSTGFRVPPGTPMGVYFYG